MCGGSAWLAADKPLSSGGEQAAVEKPGTNKAEKPVAGDKIVGRRIPNFVLPNVAGQETGLADFTEKKLLIVAFLATECPIANAYVPTLLDLEQRYRDKQVGVIAIQAQAADSAKMVEKHAQEFGIKFPVLVDSRQTTVSLFGAKRVAEVFVLDARRNVRYHGRIDDRIGYDYKRDEPRRRDLIEALDELLADKPVSVAETPAVGCLITLRERQKKKGEVTYHGQVAAIFHKHCVDCHHPGTAAPFSLLTYDAAANWSEMIREVVTQRRMPPWQADPRFGHFANERRLSPDEVDTIAAWVDGGAPQGTAQQTAPAAEFPAGWRIGKPDVVFQMPHEYTVQAQGKISYQYFTTKTHFTEDTWIQAAEARPGNRAAVHHIIVFARDPKNPRNPIWLTSTAPGADPVIFPAGLGRKIPAGAELFWQVHYTATGKVEQDRSEVGFVFCKTPPQHDVKNYGIKNGRFQIPPGDAAHKVESVVPVLKDAVILSLYPHMHVRGKDFTYTVQYPDGRREKLLSIPQYDFNWQHTYRLQTPLKLPQGAAIHCTAHFDNSAANPANPDPTQTVRWGDQTWEEMMIGYIDFYYVDEKLPAKP